MKFYVESSRIHGHPPCIGKNCKRIYMEPPPLEEAIKLLRRFLSGPILVEPLAGDVEKYLDKYFASYGSPNSGEGEA